MPKPFNNRRILLLLAFWSIGTFGQAQYVGPYKKTMRFRVYGQGARPISAKESGFSLEASEGKVEWEDSSFSVTTTFFSDEPAIKVKGDQGTMEFQVVRKDRPIEKPPILGLNFRPGKFLIPGRWAYLFSEELRSFDLDNGNQDHFLEGETEEPLPTVKIGPEVLGMKGEFQMSWMDVEQKEEGGDLYMLASTLVVGNQRNSKGLLCKSVGGQTWTATELKVNGENLRSDHLYLASEELVYIRVYESHSKPTVFYRSDDGGETWALDQVSEELGIHGMYFLKGEETGYSLGKKGPGTKLYYRSSNGSSWELRHEFEEEGMHLVHAQADICYLYHPTHRKYYQSLDQGLTWTEYELQSISSISFAYRNFFRFQDRGMHLTHGVLFDGTGLGQVDHGFRVRSWGNRSLVFLDRDNKYLVASGDGGKTWSSTPLDINGQIVDFAFVEARTILLIGPYSLTPVRF